MNGSDGDYPCLVNDAADSLVEFDNFQKSSPEFEPSKSIYGNPEYSVGVDVLPGQVEALKKKKGAIFNLLVVGQSGLGKTTFINTLFGSSILSNVWHDIEDSKANTRFGKTTKVTAHKSYLREENFNLDFTVIDTPGFGDFIDNQFTYLPITEYIDEQLRLYMFQEEQPDRSKKADNRVHACLYFINTSSRGLCPVDIEAMKHISSRVNLIPIIPKADTLTLEETLEIKSLTKQIIKIQGIKICELVEDEDVRQNIVKQIPFTVIGSESYVYSPKQKTQVLGRKYTWGVAEVANEDHCDFVKLRDLLMANNMIDLITTTESYYESCRTKLIKTRIKQAKEIFEDDEFLQGANYEYPDLNALNTCKILSKYNKNLVDELVIQWSPVFVQRQLIQKKRYNDIISHEEKKFKDWKRALFAKQASFNKEIEEIQLHIKSLSSAIHKLRKPDDNESEDVDGELSMATREKVKETTVGK
jgi:sporulation-regulated protein 3